MEKETKGLTEAAAKMVRGWLETSKDEERLARWMRDTMRLGGVKQNREIIQAAKNWGVTR